MFESLLIANRGEIARRIIRTAKRLGIRTIAVHSEADSRLPFVQEADQSFLIGPATARNSYLAQEKILFAARQTGATAIHPGYGFLSENAEFAEAVQAASLVWVGAPPQAIRAMGLKDAAKQLMQRAGVPVTPGYLGDDQSDTRLEREASLIGYPVLIKAVAGGGGKGMRRVDGPDAFLEALASCRREGQGSFGDHRVLIEKFILNPRHIEVQVFADTHGNCVHLFERDCSVQRRHQKVIEEAPAPGMDPATRAEICEAAVKAARAVNYVGAGTIEFIADAACGLRADRIWFMEMNTRLQVEHPVTEAIIGQDLVEWQLRVAAGQPLPKRQEEIAIAGWAVEGRLYAENPAVGYLPSTGRLTHLRLPTSVRVDSGVEEGDEITSFYDPMIAKVIAHGKDRDDALRNLADACNQIEIWPVKSNANLLSRLTDHPGFKEGCVDTGLLERDEEHLTAPSVSPEIGALALKALLPNPGNDPWSSLPGFRINAPDDTRARVRIAGRTDWATVASAASPRSVKIDDTMVLFDRGAAWQIGQPTAWDVEAGGTASSGAIFSPMPGAVTVVDVVAGQKVAAGERLLTVEAMKMEHTLKSPFGGTVREIRTTLGAKVSEGQLLAVISEGDE